MFKIAEYKWQATNRFSRQERGTLLAPNRETVERKLIEKGYSQIKITRNFVFSTAPKTEMVTQLLNQLALLLASAVPLKQAITILLENCRHIQLYHWLEHILISIESGFSLSEAIQKTQRYLTPQEIQLIKMGEKSGNVANILDNIAQHRIKSEKLAKKVQKILLYPIIILIFSLSLSLALLIFVVPQFAELYADKEKALPFITQILFHLSDWLKNHSDFILFLLIPSYAIWHFLVKKTDFIQKLTGFLANKLPIIRTIISYNRIIHFTQSLALMLQSQLRLDAALNTFLSVKNSDTILAKEIQFSLSLLKQGYPFSEGLNHLLPNEMVQIIKVGEQSGNLTKTLTQISQIYSSKLDHQTEILSQLLEPFMMLIIGLIVGTIIIGLYLPIFDMGAMLE